MLNVTTSSPATAPTPAQRRGQEDPLRRPHETRAPRQAPAQPSYRPDIDGLRAVAVIAVVVYHAFPGLLPGGFVGVDIFFVISGYLITQLILAGLRAHDFSLAAFYRRRVRRIVPALVVVVALCAAFGWLVLLPGEFAHLARSIAWSAGFLANAFFAQSGGYFDPAVELNPLLHLWSLGVEEQFYLIWPALMLLAFRRGLVMRILCAVTLTSFAISLTGVWVFRPNYFYDLGPRAWQLGAGAMLAASGWGSRLTALPARSGGPTWATIASVAGLALIGLSARLLSSDLSWPGAWALVPTSATVLLIAAGPSTWLNRRVLAARPVVFVGLISYSLYLWHWPLLSFARIVQGGQPSPRLAAVLVLIALMAACVTYQLVERPIRRGEVGRKAVPALLACLAVLALAAPAVQAQWLESRVAGPAVEQWELAASDWHPYVTDEPVGHFTQRIASRRPQTVLFFGDSHIDQYAPRVQRVIEAHRDSSRSAEFLTHSGCPPLPGLRSTRYGSLCAVQYERAIEEAMRPNVDTVVFGAFWEFYLLGEFSPTGRSGPRADEFYDLRDGRPTPLDVDSPETQRVLDEFRRAVAAIVSSGRRVFIVLSNPTSPAFKPQFLLPRSARLSIPARSIVSVDEEKRTVDATAFEAFVAPLMRKLREIAAQTGASVIDPRLALCDGMACPTTNAAGVPTHIDSGHITALTARERAVFIDEVLLGPSSQGRRVGRPGTLFRSTPTLPAAGR